MKITKSIIVYVIMASLMLFNGDSASLYADAMITSDAIRVNGFQIRTNDTDSVGVSFRTICKTPNIGDVVAIVADEEYRAKEVGTAYTLDVNNVYGVADTYLNPELKTQTASDGKIINYYEGVNGSHTKGFIATSDGVIDWNENDKDNLYYVRTMTKCDFSLASRYLVRAFVVAENDKGDQIFVYGSEVKVITIAQIADYIYTNSLASNYKGHCFLFDSILNVERDNYNENAYYRQEKIDYGWNDNLFTPEEPTTVIPY